MHRYEAFGLAIESEIELPELREGCGGACSVSIREGRVEEGLPERSSACLVSEGQLALQIEGVGRFLVRRGREVRVERARGAAAAELRLYLLGTVFGALLMQRRVLALHGSAIERQGVAVVFLGASGAGKSTLANGFRVFRGCPLLTDDICAVEFDAGGVPVLQPGYPQTKLWRDSLERLAVPAEGLLSVGSRMDKLALPLEDGFSPRPCPVACVYWLVAGEGQGPAFERMSGADGVLRLVEESYRKGLLRGLGAESQHLERVAALARRVPLRRLARPASGRDLRELVAKVEEDLVGACCC